MNLSNNNTSFLLNNNSLIDNKIIIITRTKFMGTYANAMHLDIIKV